MSTKTSGTYIELDEDWNDPGWTRVPNSIARCNTISRRLKGWILEVASHEPGRRFTFADMLGTSTDGRDATYSTIKEGVGAGFISRYRERDESGRLGVVVYRVHVRRQQTPSSGPLTDNPDVDGTGSPHAGKPDTGKPDMAEPDVGKAETSKKTRSSLEDSRALEDLQHTDAGASADPPDSDDLFASWPGLDLPAATARSHQNETSAGVNPSPAPPRDHERAADARTVSAAWVDAYRGEREGVAPTKRQIGQAARCAKELLDAGNDADRVIEAARLAGVAGYPTIDRQFAMLTGPRNGHAGNGRRVHVPYRDPDPSEYAECMR